MWLLDVNLPNGLVPSLQRLGLKAETTAKRGWRDLDNGALAESAGKALQRFPELTVVIIRIPQSRESDYLKEFEARLKAAPIKPSAGLVIEWP